MNAKRRKWLNPRPLCREVRRNDREQATVDAYGDSEQITGWLTIIEENLAVPFETTVLGVPVTVERIDLDCSEQIVAICRRGQARQSLPILDLPLPTPLPDGAEWIEAYRHWRAELCPDHSNSQAVRPRPSPITHSFGCSITRLTKALSSPRSSSNMGADALA
jgi:hypothetical protein